MKTAGFFRLTALAGLISLLGCSGLAIEQQAVAERDSPRQLQAHQLIVTLPDGAPEGWEAIRRALAAEYEMREVGNFPLSSIRVQCVVFQLPAEHSLLAVMERLKRDPRVESVQPNQVFRALGIDTRTYRELEYGAAAIRADLAHRTSTGKGVRVALVDTGVDRNHPELRGRISRFANFVERGESSFDEDRHGTAVAGVIGARDDAGAGISGIAPEAELVAIKACWHPPGGTAKALCSSWTLAKAVDYAINAGAQVLNMSLTGPSDALLARLLVAAHRRGMTLVAAATEDKATPGFPASLEPVVAVVASDARGRVQPRAWKANKPLLAAPGIDVLTTVPGERYDFVSGSSLAAAHVSGVVALLLQRAPQLPPARAAEILSASAQPAAFGNSVGVVDACAALARLGGETACR